MALAEDGLVFVSATSPLVECTVLFRKGSHRQQVRCKEWRWLGFCNRRERSRLGSCIAVKGL
ncbi:hypothetical protein M758_4G227500 [Ceratodon purpureus]|nr:hypothetical protein M758_4G227500 [Ceratodon purpureus]